MALNKANSIKKGSESYKDLFKYSLGYLFLVNKKGILLDVNNNALRDLGYSREDIVGKNVQELVSEKSMPQIKENLSQLFSGKSTAPIEIITKKKNKEIMYIKTAGNNIYVYDSKNELIGLLVYAVDITATISAEDALKESEKRYKELFENLADGIWVVDKDIKIIDVNSKLCDILGYTKEEMLGKSITDFYADKSVKESVLKNLKRVLGGEPVFVERTLMTKSGKPIHVAMNTRKIKEEEGILIESIRDIDEVKQLKSRLKSIEERSIDLTKKEKLVLYGIVRWPDLNDQEIADRIGVKRPTVTAIKNKLKREGYYKFVRIPNPYLLGIEAIDVCKHRFKHSREEGSLLNIPELVYHVSSKSDSIGISFSKDFNEIRSKLDQCSHKTGAKELIHIKFALEESTLTRLFDFSESLKHLFNIEINDKRAEFLFEKKPKKLTYKEKNILYALVKYPDETDTEIAELTRSARATVSSIKRKMISGRYLKTVVLPDMGKLGNSLLIFTHAKISPKHYENFEVLCKESLKHTPNKFLKLCCPKEVIDISSYREYAEHKMLMERFIAVAESKELLLEKPEEIVLPLESDTNQYINFADIVKKSLDIRENI